MVKIRRGWYLIEHTNDEEKKRDERKAELENRQYKLMKQCEKKIAQQHLQAEQREACEKEKLLRAQEAANLKQKEIETSHKLATELARRRDEEVKQMLKTAGTKFIPTVVDTCVRSRWIEEKVRLESKQAELLNSWHQDESFIKLEEIEKEEKKQKLNINLQKQLADHSRYVQERKFEEDDQDRKMIKQVMQQIRDEDAKIKKKKDDAILLRTDEMASFMASKKAWEEEYKETLKHEDERIACIIAKKETQQKELLDKKAELRAMREATIDKIANKLLDDAHKKREREKILNEYYQEEQMLKWAEEPAMLVSRKQYAITESLKEMMRRQEAIAECKAKSDAIDYALTQYLTAEYKKDVEKQKKCNAAKKIQYRKELKEAIRNNKVSYAMNIVKRQFEIHAPNHLLITTSVKPNDTSDNKNTKK